MSHNSSSYINYVAMQATGKVENINPLPTSFQQASCKEVTDPWRKVKW